jgi:hypothetical protein
VHDVSINEGFSEMVTIRFDKLAVCSLRVTWGVLLLLTMSASCCYAAEVVLIRSPASSSTEQEQLEIAARLYGLDLKIVIASSSNDDLALRSAVERDDTVGVAIAANALAFVNQNALLRALHRRGGSDVPLLILGVARGLDPALLRAWSGGTAFGCKRLESPPPSQYVFGRVAGLTEQLADLEFPFPMKDASYLELGENSATQRITSIRHDQRVFPVFIETAIRQRKLFVACAVPPDESSNDREGIVSAFLRIAPAAMFSRYCAGERGWHALHHYANFTIDDPWLRQPYGYLDYQGLLGEMEKHGFHTSIAFIPWNFDRSQSGVVSLFRNHPERFSIAIHGDNHDHKEFTDYRNKPLAVQVADLKQSLARMEKFQALTGIPYDKVMIFPHSIAPERTLEALKTYNYLATINSTNVPQDAVKPSALSFDLRSVTLSFAGFPSISRYPAAVPVPEEFVAINEFLGNPLLFYAHSDLFARGIDAFDGVADEVNKLEPDTEWRSLGEIVRHLYLVKQRDDSNYDVLAFSSSICLDNVSGRDSIFYAEKQESGGQIIKSVIVDGQQQPYRLRNGYLDFTVSIPKGNTRCVVVQYENDLELASIGTSKDSLVDYFLRMASDFRDIYLSKSAVGPAIIRFYDELEEKPVLGLAFVLVFIGICVYAGHCWRVIVRKRRRPTNETWNRSSADQTVGERVELPPERKQRLDPLKRKGSC